MGGLGVPAEQDLPHQVQAGVPPFGLVRVVEAGELEELGDGLGAGDVLGRPDREPRVAVEGNLSGGEVADQPVEQGGHLFLGEESHQAIGDDHGRPAGTASSQSPSRRSAPITWALPMASGSACRGITRSRAAITAGKSTSYQSTVDGGAIRVDRVSSPAPRSSPTAFGWRATKSDATSSMRLARSAQVLIRLASMCN